MGIIIKIVKEDSFSNYPKFLFELNKLYNGEFFRQKFMDPDKLCVRWFMQESTFSYEIFKQKNAFLGKPEYVSKVFWHGNDKLNIILKDIKLNLRRIKDESIQTIDNKE